MQFHRPELLCEDQLKRPLMQDSKLTHSCRWSPGLEQCQSTCVYKPGGKMCLRSISYNKLILFIQSPLLTLPRHYKFSFLSQYTSQHHEDVYSHHYE